MPSHLSQFAFVSVALVAVGACADPPPDPPFDPPRDTRHGLPLGTPDEVGLDVDRPAAERLDRREYTTREHLVSLRSFALTSSREPSPAPTASPTHAS